MFGRKVRNILSQLGKGCPIHFACSQNGGRKFRDLTSKLGCGAEIELICGKEFGGGGGSRTRVRRCYWSRDYMRSRVHAPGITRERSRRALRTDKKRESLACGSHPRDPDVVAQASPLCDALPQPTGEAAESGYLTN